MESHNQKFVILWHKLMIHVLISLGFVNMLDLLERTEVLLWLEGTRQTNLSSIDH